MANENENRIARQEIVDLLLPHVITVQQRTSLVIASWGPQTKLQYEIDFEGSGIQFAERFATETLKFGRSLGERDTAAIELVLEYIRDQVGYEQQVEIDGLLANLRDENQALLSLRSPYMGLEPYEEDDHNLFFGRFTISEKLLRRIDGWDLDPAETRLLTIIGASGSGKSSLVKAGLLPKLRESKKWRIITAQPGELPLFDIAVHFVPPNDLVKDLEEQMLDSEQALQKAIKQRLARDWSEIKGILLYLDQFEQLFTFEPAIANEALKKEARAERQAVVDNLLYAASAPGGPMRLIISMRADFYHRAADYDNLRAMFNDHQEYIGVISVEELVEIVQKPAELLGYRLEEGLTGVIIDDLDARDGRPEPGSLPLLSHALRETWEVRQAATLRLVDYNKIGGVKGALRKKADDVYGQLPPDEQKLARFIFLRLTQLGEGTEDTRRRVYQEDLVFADFDRESVQLVITKLTNARLLVTGRSEDKHRKEYREIGTSDKSKNYVEVAHEALIREWPQLREWLDKDRDAIRVQRRLTNAARLWHNNNEDPAYLFSGIQLHEAQRWVEEVDLHFTLLEQHFLAASQARRQRSRIITGIGIAVVIGLVLLVIGLQMWNNSRLGIANNNLQAESTKVAESLIAEGAAKLEASNNLELAQTNEQRAVRQLRALRTQVLSDLSLEINQTKPELATLLALQAAHLNQPGNLSVARMVDGALRSALNPEDTFYYNTLAHTAPIEQLLFTPDGRQLHARDRDKQIVTWDLDDLDARSTTTLDFGQDIASFGGICGSNELALVQNEGNLQLWNPQLDQLVPFSPPDEFFSWTDVTMSNDGQMAAAASKSGPIYVWNTAVPEDPPLRLQSPPDYYAWALTFIPNSSFLASAGNDGAILLWPLANLEDGPTPLIARNVTTWRDIASSADGRWLAAAGENGKVHLWDLNTPAEESLLIGEHDGVARAVAFSPDGQQIVSGGEDSNIFRWLMEDLVDGKIVPRTLQGHEQDIRTLAFSCDSHLLASGAGDQTIRLWDLQGPLAEAQPLSSQESQTTAGHKRRVTSLHFTEPDQLLVSAGLDGQVWAWDWQSRSDQPKLLTPNQDNPPVISTDAKAQRLATITEDGALQISSSDGTTQYLHTNITIGENPALALAGDGQSVVVTAGENNAQIRFWDLRQDINEHLLGEHEDTIIRLLFSPDGRTLASASDDQTVRLWPLADDGSEPVVLRGHDESVVVLAFSPDGTLLASGDRNNVILIWNLNAPEIPPHRLTRHQSDISALAFSADGRLLASAAAKDLFIWELGNLVGPIQLESPDNIGSLAFSPGSHILASSSGFLGDIYIWPTLIGLTDIGCQAVGRNLSWEEWQRFLPGEPYCPVCPDLEPHHTVIEAGSYDPASCPPDS